MMKESFAAADGLMKLVNDDELDWKPATGSVAEARNMLADDKTVAFSVVESAGAAPGTPAYSLRKSCPKNSG